MEHVSNDDVIMIGTAGAIMFVDDSWMLNQQENIEKNDTEQDN